MRKHLRKIFLLLIPIFFFAFNFQDNVGSGWYLQSIPLIHGAYIVDVAFTDSLTGYAITQIDSFNTGYIFKTTNGGDNWNINKTEVGRGFSRISFLNKSTGFVGSKWASGGSRLYKTTNAGDNWITLNNPGGSTFQYEDMSVLDTNEIWATDPIAFDGGLFRSTNGGLNWTRMFFNTLFNPDKIYMYNTRLGFMRFEGDLYRTSNGGSSWDTIRGEHSTFDFEIRFADSLTAWKNNQAEIKKTTNGGVNWFVQTIPSSKVPGYILSFGVINKDTVWGCGGYEYISPGNERTRIYKTTNGGLNWGYQTPAPEVNSNETKFMRFTDKNHLWSYSAFGYGFHTKIGGNDSTIYVGVQQISSEVPSNLKLYQNYPNPFNPTTKINYELRIADYVVLKVFDINGREISTLVNQKQSAGKYEYTFDGSFLSTGIYFYTLQTENYKETKKMMLVK
ncbi:MAG: T9SS type A sorting domain-containing protein [Ignavibacteria bacterium]|nr:T9SS type A sorting domain-containing protein [Ignavibacteria bacterium]